MSGDGVSYCAELLGSFCIFVSCFVDGIVGWKIAPNKWLRYTVSLDEGYRLLIC